MQSVIAATKTISAVSKANPGVVSSTTHGYANGDFVTVLATGMNQINNRVFRVANQASGTWELEGEDTTNYDTFSAGTSALLTFGTTFSTFADVSASGGEAEMKDVTTIHDSLKKLRPGMFSALEFSIDSHWDMADPALKAAIAASKINAERAFLFTFSNGTKMAFTGFIGAKGVPVGSTGEIVTTKLAITATGTPTYFTT
jgi:hypothetical protein